MKLPCSSTLAGFFVLALCAVLSGGLHALLRPAPPPRTWEAELRSQIQSHGFGIVGRDELVALRDAGGIVLDARELKAHVAGHIPGSQPLPLRDFEAHFPDIAPLLGLGLPLVIYCSGPTCDDALQLALRLREAGFDGANIYPGGWEEWSASP